MKRFTLLALAMAAGIALSGCATYPNSYRSGPPPGYGNPAYSDVYSYNRNVPYYYNNAPVRPAYPYGYAPNPYAQGQYYSNQQQYAPSGDGRAYVGAIAGGLIGHQVGQGNGRTAATAAGAVLGSGMASGCVNPIGAIAGGLIGQLAGRGNGRDAAAAAGATVGSRMGCP